MPFSVPQAKIGILTLTTHKERERLCSTDAQWSSDQQIQELGEVRSEGWFLFGFKISFTSDSNVHQ